MSRPRPVAPLSGTITGLALLLVPPSVFAPVAASPWEVDLLRFAGLAVIGVGLIWPWAMAQDHEIRRRTRRWVGTALVMAFLYPLLANSLFLILGFALLTGGLLNLAMERAERASQALGRRLGLRKRQP